MTSGTEPDVTYAMCPSIPPASCGTTVHARWTAGVGVGEAEGVGVGVGEGAACGINPHPTSTIASTTPIARRPARPLPIARVLANGRQREDRSRSPRNPDLDPGLA